MINMNLERTTITIDHLLAERIRKMFNGNLSLGINKLLEEQIGEKNPLKETFGTLKFKGSTEKLLKEIDRELWNDDE